MALGHFKYTVLLAAAVEVRHVLVGRYIVAVMVDHYVVGHIAERRRSCRSVEAAVHCCDLRGGGRHRAAAAARAKAAAAKRTGRALLAR